jgi:hypothetical protein
MANEYLTGGPKFQCCKNRVFPEPFRADRENDARLATFPQILRNES